MSLRRRVLLGFTLVAAVLLLTNLALATTFQDYLMARTDEELAALATRPIWGPGGIDPVRPGWGQQREQPLSDTFIAVADDAGEQLSRVGYALDEDESEPSPSPSELVAHAGPAGRTQPFTVASANGDASWRVVAIDDRVEGGLLVLGSNLDDVAATLDRLRRIQVVGSVSVALALGAVAWWVLRLGVRPVVAMATTADEIAAGDLSRRVDHVDPGTEAGRLGLAFNSMLTEIEEAFRQREASEARLRRFAADASHELRTPLTSIRGYAELWETGGLREPGQLDQAMRRLGEEGRRMGSLVEDLLLLARLDEQPTAQQSPVPLHHLAADAVVDAEAVEPDRSIELDAEPVLVQGDESQLRQVVGNLVTNARVHTPPVTPITVRVRREGALARLEVHDDGPGIDPDALGHVFDRFYRADSSRGRAGGGQGGSGLGLSIVDAVVRAHGGSVSASSTPGDGTTFVVQLPIAPSAPPPVAPGEVVVD